MDRSQQHDKLPPEALQFLQSLTLLTSALPGSDQRQRTNILNAAIKEFLPEEWKAENRKALIAQAVNECYKQISKPRYSRYQSVQPCNAAMSLPGVKPDKLNPQHCELLYSPLLTASSLLAGQPQVLLQTTCTQCPVCGAQVQVTGSPAAVDGQQAPVTVTQKRPVLTRANNASYPLVLTMTGPKQGQLKQYRCSECECLIALHTATTPEGLHVMLDQPLEEVGVMAVHKGLYIEYALLQQLLLMLHTLGCSYQRLSQLYNCQWSWQPNKPALSPDGSDLQRAFQLFALNTLDWRETIWPWVLQQPQESDKNMQEHQKLAKHSHPGVLFVYGCKEHHGRSEDDATAAITTAVVEEGTQDQRLVTVVQGGQSLSSPVGPNTPSPLLQRNRRKRALAQASDSPDPNATDRDAGLIAATRIAVRYLESRYGGLQHHDEACSHKLCHPPAKVVLIDGTSRNLLLHCCAQPGCEQPPVNRKGGATAANVLYCQEHMSTCSSNQTDITFPTGAGAPNANPYSMDDHTDSSQQVTNGVQFKGLLGMFAPCGQLLAFSVQYIPEQASSILGMLSGYYKQQLPGVIVYNDTPEVLQYLKDNPQQEATWRGRFVMDVLRWQIQWKAAMAAVSGNKEPDTGLVTPQALAACSPFEKEMLKQSLQVRHGVGSQRLTLSQAQHKLPAIRKLPWHAICQPNAYHLPAGQARILMQRSLLDADEDDDDDEEEEEEGSSNKKYVYIQVEIPRDQLSDIHWDTLDAAAAASIQQCMAQWPVQVFRLELATQLAESGWRSLGYRGLSSVSKMTHDHGYIHMHLTAAAASEHKAACISTAQHAGRLAAERREMGLTCSQARKLFSVPAVLAPSCISLPVCLNLPQRWPRVRQRLPWREPERIHGGCNDVHDMDYERSESHRWVVELSTTTGNELGQADAMNRSRQHKQNHGHVQVHLHPMFATAGPVCNKQTAGDQDQAAVLSPAVVRAGAHEPPSTRTTNNSHHAAGGSQVNSPTLHLERRRVQRPKYVGQPRQLHHIFNTARSLASALDEHGGTGPVATEALLEAASIQPIHIHAAALSDDPGIDIGDSFITTPPAYQDLGPNLLNTQPVRQGGARRGNPRTSTAGKGSVNVRDAFAPPAAPHLAGRVVTSIQQVAQQLELGGSIAKRRKV